MRLRMRERIGGVDVDGLVGTGRLHENRLPTQPPLATEKCRAALVALQPREGAKRLAREDGRPCGHALPGQAHHASGIVTCDAQHLAQALGGKKRLVALHEQDRVARAELDQAAADRVRQEHGAMRRACHAHRGADGGDASALLTCASDAGDVGRGHGRGHRGKGPLEHGSTRKLRRELVGAKARRRASGHYDATHAPGLAGHGMWRGMPSGHGTRSRRGRRRVGRQHGEVGVEARLGGGAHVGLVAAVGVQQLARGVGKARAPAMGAADPALQQAHSERALGVTHQARCLGVGHAHPGRGGREAARAVDATQKVTGTGSEDPVPVVVDVCPDLRPHVSVAR